MLIILGSSVDVIVGDLYDHLMSTRIFTLIVNMIFMSFQNHEESGYGLDLDLLTISLLTIGYDSYPKRSWEK